MASLGPVGKRYALLVGVNRYDDDGLPALKYALSDVEALRERLTAYGFEVTCLHDQAPKRPSKGNVIGELQRILSLTDPEDLVLVHFSCHGKARDEQHYLLLADTHLNSFQQTALLVSNT